MMVMIVGIYGQSVFRSESYSTNEGISSIRCKQMIKDAEGFIWISSDKGLNRYDGNSFYVFKHRPDDPTSLANNKCNGLLIDSKTRLWVNTEDGLSLYDKNKQDFINFYPDTSVMSVLSLSYTQMAEDIDGRIWIGGLYDVLIFDTATKKFKSGGWYDFAKKAGIIKFDKRNSIIQSIAKKSKNELWLLTVYGLFSVDTRSMKYSYYPSQEINDYFAYSISYIDRSGVLWIGTYDQCFYTFDPNDHKWTHHKCPPQNNNNPDQMVVLKPYSNDSLIMMRAYDILTYHVGHKTFRRINLADDQKDIFPATNINLAIFDGDVYILRNEEPVLTRYFKSPDIILKQNIPFPNGFINNTAYCIHNNKTLVGDWVKNKILVCDSSSCKTLTDKNGQSQIGQLQLYYHSLSGVSYMSTSKAVYIFNEEKNVVTPLNHSGCFDPNVEIEFRNFVEDNEGNIYVRERNKGIFRVNQHLQTLEYFDIGLNDHSYGALYYDKATDKFWVATDKNGLYVIDPLTKRYKNYPLSTTFSFKKGYISDISGDGFGNVFLLMPGRGMMHIKSKTMEARLYAEKDGLISDEVRYGYVSGDGKFWFTTESGIMAFDIYKKGFVSFKKEPDAHLFFHRIFPDEAGNICQNLFPGQIIKLNRNIKDYGMAVGKIYLKEATLFGKKLDSESKFTFDHDENSIEFMFGLLSTTGTIQAEIEYNINEQPWQKLENEMALNLFNLSPGKYIIGIRQKYHPETLLSIVVTIRHPWWNAWWFYALMISGIAMSGFWLYFYRIASVRKEEAEKNALHQRISQIEMTALRAQMNPHFIFNCLNSINRFILVNDTDAASEYLTKFSRLIRVILDASREDVISLQRELDALNLYIGMESMRFQDSFEWRIEVDQNVQTENVLLPPLLLQPYVENAIWHGLMQAPSDWGVKKLYIVISSENDGHHTIITISDNGIGRQKAAQMKSKEVDGRKSYGILLAQERLKLLSRSNEGDGTVEIRDLMSPNGQGIGTSVIIRLSSMFKNVEV